MTLRICEPVLGCFTNGLLMTVNVSWASQNGQSEFPMELVDDMTLIDLDSTVFENEFDQHYGLLAPEQTVLVRAFSDDSDDRMLAEIRPKFIVMFEPNMEFIRRIEVGAIDLNSAGNTHGRCDVGIQEL
jgi:hypothetical protein